MSEFELRCSTTNYNNHHHSGINISIPHPIKISFPDSMLVQLQRLFEASPFETRLGYFLPIHRVPSGSGIHITRCKLGNGALSSKGSIKDLLGSPPRSDETKNAWTSIISTTPPHTFMVSKSLILISYTRQITDVLSLRDLAGTKISVTLLQNSAAPSLKLGRKYELVLH